MSPGEEGRYRKKLARLSLASGKDQCGAVKVFRRNKRKLEEKMLEVLKVAIGARKEQPDADEQGQWCPAPICG